MKINRKYYATKRHDGVIVTNLLGKKRLFGREITPEYTMLLRIVKIMGKRVMNKEVQSELLNRAVEEFVRYEMPFVSDSELVKRYRLEEVVEEQVEDNKVVEEEVVDFNAIKKEIAKCLLDFFSEFNFTPSFRFVNTLGLVNNKKEYVTNYFTIQDHEYSSEIAEKVKSQEFNGIVSMMSKLEAPKEVINNRMKLYFGEPGTGKTTHALTESDKCVVCSSDMLPTDLMQNFAFNDGKAEFQKSDLWNAMENGETIILDEINMLPFESLRFLQGITDGKTSIDYKGFNINIKDGFKIIGTMNLNLGGNTLPIPSPLVDRCSDIVEYKMSAELLMNAL